MRNVVRVVCGRRAVRVRGLVVDGDRVVQRRGGRERGARDRSRARRGARPHLLGKKSFKLLAVFDLTFGFHDLGTKQHF